MIVVDKRTGDKTKIYKIKNNKNGYPMFLTYKSNQWKWESAKHFIPADKVKTKQKYNENLLIKQGEIVYTKSSKVILDIGWVESLNPLIIQAPWLTKYDKTPNHYGNAEGGNWFKTNILLTENEWKELSDNIYAPEICKKLNIDYEFDT